MYYTYMIRCADNSIYTGITTDITRRFKEHSDGSGKGAKYTHSHQPKEIIAVFGSADRSTASKLEYRIKKLSKSQKEMIVQNQNLDILSNQLDTTAYTYILSVN